MKAPNISAWRRHHAGDLTSTLHPRHGDASVPKLPSTSKDQTADVMAEGCTEAMIVEAAPASALPVLPRAGAAVDAASGDGLTATPGPGTVVVLNGTPRSGKSSIAAALQESSGADALWLNLGVDAFAGVTPRQLRPGIGLRPGGERPDLEDDRGGAVRRALRRRWWRGVVRGAMWSSTSAITTTTRSRWGSCPRWPGTCGIYRPSSSGSAARSRWSRPGGMRVRPAARVVVVMAARVTSRVKGTDRSPTSCTAGSGPCTTRASTTWRWTRRRRHLRPAPGRSGAALTRDRRLRSPRWRSAADALPG